MDNAFNEAGEGDIKTLVPLMYAIVIVIMALSLRTFWGTLTTVLIMAFSILTGMGLAGWSGDTFDLHFHQRTHYHPDTCGCRQHSYHGHPVL